MGGNIVAASEYGKGSQFHCTVKLHRINPQADPWVLIPSDLQSLKVMIIDNHAATRGTIAETIQSLGWDAIAVANDADAIQKLADPGALSYDLLLLITRLSDTGYRETIHAIDAALPAAHPLKIILITSNMDPQFSKEIATERMTGILIRPFTPLSLFDTVTALFNETETGGTGHKQTISDAAKQFTGAHVLVAEDNEFNQTLITELLSNSGIAVSLAGNGAECLDLLKTAESPFDLIFMDIQMPQMDGLEATQRIRHDLHLTDIPIVALSANIMEQDQQEFIKTGINAFLPKPFDPGQLQQILERFLKREK